MRAARAGRRIVMRPTEHGFVGPLAGELEEYIRFKASMGRHGATRVQVLRSFDRHCLEHGAVRLERGVVERWIAHRIDANPGGCRSWFSYIRDFGRWMRLAHDPDAYVLSDQWKAGSPRPTPYLLTDREAALFLRAAGTLESPSPWAWQSRAFFMLMACCGLRTREVRRLAVGHVDHKARSIGVDVMAMLPYLAAYMGHAGIDSTLYYVHASPDFMDGYADLVADAERVVPETEEP